MHTLAQLRSGALAGASRLDLQCGLTEFPPEIFDLADSLEILNLTGNRLQSLPDDLGRLSNLRILFCSENQFTHLPPALGDCPRLSMIGFKANQIESIDPASFPAALRWLILTDNRIQTLPAALGHCLQLQKLMLSGNRLSSLPATLANSTRLELLRIAANAFQTLPPWLLDLPRLTWLAFAGNPCSTPSRSLASALPAIPWPHLHLEAQLGEGASGSIHRALWNDTQPVAVKLFKGAVTSDGLPACEMEASLAAGQHPHLIPILGSLSDHPLRTEGLVMALVDPAYTTLADPPSLDSCTRDVYSADLRLAPRTSLSIALGIASAAAHLHSLGINHGDLYAHNVLWHSEGHSYLGDFGAASFYPPELSPALQRIEARAFGCLLEELLARTDWTPEQQPVEHALHSLQNRCVSPRLGDRPLLQEIVTELEQLNIPLSP
jgi:hypothetical protein